MCSARAIFCCNYKTIKYRFFVRLVFEGVFLYWHNMLVIKVGRSTTTVKGREDKDPFCLMFTMKSCCSLHFIKIIIVFVLVFWYHWSDQISRNTDINMRAFCIHLRSKIPSRREIIHGKSKRELFKAASRIW